MHGRDSLSDANGYDALADEFAARRDTSTIGVATVREWARQLTPGAAVLDIGCGSGVPISQALLDAGFAVHGVDASPNMVTAFRKRFPGAPVLCEPIERATLHGRTFDGIVSWGLLFLLPADAQRLLIDKAAAALAPGGRLLVTAPWQTVTWNDVLTGRESCSLGGEAYRRLIAEAGLTLVAELDDEGDNHYYSAMKRLPRRS